MALHRPRVLVVIFAMVNPLIVIGLAVLGWGDWSSFVAHPARVGFLVVTVVLIVASLFTDCEPFSRGKREDVRNRWIFAPIILLSLLMAWLPAYCDRHELWVLDGDLVRYLGLTLYFVGGLLRIGPVFELGRRFSGLVAIQEDHRLETTGFYRWIRHPSYLGLIVLTTGWVLVFRSLLGLLLVLLMVPVLIARIHAEEALLLSEFGEEYAAYRRRTWRLLPFLY
jgi:protein-S-isoprenylcysteine O-methyltransferase Ste14